MSDDRTMRFGVFELDLAARQLRKNGTRIKLQDQPFRVLQLLLECPGEVVTREELKERLWSDDTFVEFDHSLNTAVQKIRRALSDAAESPRFVETIPRQGYRFIAPVEAEARSTPVPSPQRNLRWVVIAAGAAVLVVVFGLAFFRAEPSEPLSNFASRPLTYDAGSERSPSFSPDGNWVAYSADGGNPDRADIYISLAEPGAGAPVRVTNSPWIDVDPAWSPDGKQIVFARVLEARTAHLGSPFKLILVPPVENAQEQELTNEVFVSRNATGMKPSWSKDGKYILFACRLSEPPQNQVCVYSLERREVWPLTFPTSGIGDGRPALSPDGRTLVYWAGRRPGEVGLFLQALTPEMRPDGEPRAVQGGDGIQWAAWSRDGRTLYFMGTTIAGEHGLWSTGVSSNDKPQLLWPVFGRRPSFWEGPSGELKIAHVSRVQDAEIVLVDLQDPSPEPVKVLAPSNGTDYHPQFSPDGSQVVFLSDRSGTIGIWICEREGSDVYHLADIGLAGFFTAPTWSPDGTRIAADGFYMARNAHIIDVATRRVGPALTTREGRMPTWTNDGKALYYYSDIGGKRALWKLDLESNEPTKLLERPGIFDIAESLDGRSIYFLQGYNLMRVALANGELAGEPEQIESEVAAFAPAPGSVYFRTRSGAIRKRDETTGATNHVMQTDGKVDADNIGFSVSRDERWLVYTRWGRWETDLELLESVE